MTKQLTTSRLMIGALTCLLLVASACSAKTGVKALAPTSTSGASSATTAPQGMVASTSPPSRWVAAGLHPVSPVLASDDEFFVTIQRPDKSLAGVAVDAATGKVLWEQSTVVSNRIPGMGLPSPQPVKGAHGWVVVQLESTGGQIALGAPEYAYVAREERTGRRLWSYPVRYTIEVDACGEVVCVESETSDNNTEVVGLDADSGAKRWAVPSRASTTVLASDATSLVTLSLGLGSTLTSIDYTTGATRWTFRSAVALGAGATSDGGWNATRSGNVLIVNLGSSSGSPNGSFALDVNTGKLVWVRKGADTAIEFPLTFQITPPGEGPSVPADRPLVVERAIETDKSFDTTLMQGLRASTGESLWSIPLKFHYVYNGAEPLSVISQTGQVAWIRDPTTKTPVGINLATGASVPARGVGWKVSVPFDTSVKVPGVGSFTPPYVTTQVSVPDLKPRDGGTPPLFLDAISASSVAWLGANNVLTAAPKP